MPYWKIRLWRQWPLVVKSNTMGGALTVITQSTSSCRALILDSGWALTSHRCCSSVSSRSPLPQSSIVCSARTPIGELPLQVRVEVVDVRCHAEHLACVTVATPVEVPHVVAHVWVRWIWGKAADLREGGWGREADLREGGRDSFCMREGGGGGFCMKEGGGSDFCVTVESGEGGGV
jgi:hypothetical protein